MSERRGKIQTVRGLIEPATVGIALCHEHLFLNAEPLRCPALHQPEQVAKLPFRMENLGLIRQYYNSNDSNLILDDYSAVAEEMHQFKKRGGSLVAENTIVGLQPRAELLKSLSEQTGVHITAGTGYYLDCAHTDLFKNSVGLEQKVEFMRNELTTGIGQSAIRAGHIGEIGCSYPLTPFERSSLQAAAAVQEELGAPLVVHPGRDPASPAEICRVLSEAGADLGKVIMSHTDRTVCSREQLLAVADLGTLVAFDMFGLETSWYPVNAGFDMPSDGQRIEHVRYLLGQGLEDRLVLAHDIWTKHRLSKYGGHGYSHILTNIVPRMKMRGVTDDQVDKMLRRNTVQWLTFQK